MASLIATPRARLRMRRALLVMSTILCSGLAAPAWAQTASATVDNTDDNGIDLTTLNPVQGTDVAWAPQLVTVRVQSSGGAGVDLQTIRLMRRPSQ